MSLKPVDSESDDLELKFDSCVNITVTVHNQLLKQLLDAHNHITPSVNANSKFGEKNADYTDISLTIADPAQHRINWDYMNPDPAADHGFCILEVVSVDAKATNPISQMQRRMNTLFEEKLRRNFR